MVIWFGLEVLDCGRGFLVNTKLGSEMVSSGLDNSGRVSGNQSTAGLGNQGRHMVGSVHVRNRVEVQGIGVTLAQVMVGVSIESIPTSVGQMSSSGGLVGGIQGNEGSVGVGNKSSISLSITLPEVMVGQRMAVGSSQVSGCSCLVSRVKGNNSPVGVGHQTTTHVTNQTQSYQFDHVGWVAFSRVPC